MTKRFSILVLILVILPRVWAASTPSGPPFIYITPQGTGAGQTGEVRWLGLLASGSNYVGLKAPDSIAANTVFVLPSADGAANRALGTDGSKNLTWLNVLLNGASASGDLSGTLPNPTVAKLNGDALPTNAAHGFLKRNAANTGFEEVTYGTATNSVCQGNDARLSDSRAPNGTAGGDLGGSYPTPTINASAVTNAKLANMAGNTFKGNNTGSSASPIDLTVAQTKTLLAISASDIAELSASATGTQLTPFDNWIDNPNGQLNSRGSMNSSDISGTRFPFSDRWKYSCTASLLGATNTASAISIATVGQSGFALQWAGSTGSSDAKIFFSQFIGSDDAQRLKNQTCCLSALVWQNSGSAVNFKLNIYKCTFLNNMGTGLTTIQLGSPISVATSTGTRISTGGVAMGDTSNGLLVEIECDLGTATSKTIQITDVQLQTGSVYLPCRQRTLAEEQVRCQRYFWKWIGGAANRMIAVGSVQSTTNIRCILPLPTPMFAVPSVSVSSGTDFAFANGSSSKASTAFASGGGQTIYAVDLSFTAGTSTGFTAGTACICYSANSSSSISVTCEP